MPVYEYQCKKCGNIFDREHAIGEKKKFKCPECSSIRTHKIISQVGVIFKGNGFYSTDNRSSNGGAVKTSKSQDKKPAGCPKEKSSDDGGSTDSACEGCPMSKN